MTSTPRPWLVLALLGVLAAASLTDYGVENPGAATTWSVVGAVLVGLVAWRRSRTARAVLLFQAWVCATVYVLASLGERSPGHALAVAAAYLVQVVALSVPAVRRHVAAPRVTADARPTS